MAKRGRKPKERKGYFYEREEDAVKTYISSTDNVERNQIYNSVLHPAFTKMIESIIRRYKLYVPDEEFNQTFNDTISYLLTKINNYKPIIYDYSELEGPISAETSDIVEYDYGTFVQKNWNEEDPELLKVTDTPDLTKAEYDEDGVMVYCPTRKEPVVFQKLEKKYKAYSYCGTVCRHYLLYRNVQFVKNQTRNTPYDTVADVFETDMRYSTTEENSASEAEKLIGETATEIQKMLDNPSANALTDNEIKVGKALVNLLNNWEEVLSGDGSNKLQKSAVLYFLREETLMSTKEIRDNMKPYKALYKFLKKASLE